MTLYPEPFYARTTSKRVEDICRQILRYAPLSFTKVYTIDKSNGRYTLNYIDLNAKPLNSATIHFGNLLMFDYPTFPNLTQLYEFTKANSKYIL